MTTSGIASRGYEFLRELSNDETGAVFKALSPEDRKTVALRIIRPGPHAFTTVSAVVERATKALQLNSPNIVLAHAAYEEDGLVYIVTDYAEGVTLASAIISGKLSDWDVLDTARQVSAAIDHAHSRSISHLNLNPANIVQEWDGTVKVMDYGVTVDLGQQVLARPDRLPAAHYLAPEQTSGAFSDHRSNLFSLGSILYEMLTGQKAFAADNPQALFGQIRCHEPTSPHLLHQKVSHATSRVILKSLAKVPEQRYDSGSELVRELENAMRSKATIAVPVASSRLPVPSVPQTAASAASMQSPQPRKPADVGDENERAESSKSTHIPSPAATLDLPASGPTEPPAPRLEPTPRNEFLIVGPRHPEMQTVQAVDSSRKVETRTAAPAGPHRGHQPANTPKRIQPTLFLLAAVCLVVAAAGIGLLVRSTSKHKPAQVVPSATSSASTGIAEQPVITSPSEDQPAETAEASQPQSAKRKRQTLAAAITPAAAVSASLTVESTPLGAAIRIDGQPTAFRTPTTIGQLAPGNHTISLSSLGFDDSTRTVQLTAGQREMLTFKLNESRGIVAIATEPPGAELAIDGNPTGRVTPVTVALLRGSHTFSFRKNGYVPASSSVDVSPGQNYRVSPRLVALGDATKVKELGKLNKLFGRDGGMARLQFRSVPKGAQISVNQRTMGKVTPAELAFPSGTYEIDFTLPGYKPFHQTVQVLDATNSKVEATLEPAPR